MKKLTPEEKRARNREACHARYYRNWHKERQYQREYYRRRLKALKAERLAAEAGRDRPKCCDICGSDKRRIHFDHCHQRGVFRGWICANCNVAIGMVQDDPDILRKMIAYLERTKDVISPQLTLPGI